MLGSEPTLPYVFDTDPGILTYSLPAAMPVYDAGDITITIENADGDVLQELVRPTHYSLQIAARTYAAKVIFVDDTWLTSGNKCVVDRATARTQPVRFSELDDFPGVSDELQHDRSAALGQDIWARLVRTVMARRGETLPVLPAADDFAGSLFYLNADKKGWSILDAEYFEAIGADLALGETSNINRIGPHVTSVVAVGDDLASILLLAPVAGELGSLADNLDTLLGFYDTLSLPIYGVA